MALLLKLLQVQVKLLRRPLAAKRIASRSIQSS